MSKFNVTYLNSERPSGKVTAMAIAEDRLFYDDCGNVWFQFNDNRYYLVTDIKTYNPNSLW